MAKKYEIVVCIGDPWDYSYELIDVVSNWKAAREYYLKGANVYLNGKKVKFVDHKAVAEAFKSVALDVIVNLDVYEDTAFIADVRRKSAEDTLKENGLVAEDAIKAKIEKRYNESLCKDPLEEPLYKRHVQFMPIYSADTHKLVKVVNGKIDTDELPF